MTVSPWLTFAVSVVGILLVPLIVLLFRVVVNATRLEDKVQNIADDLTELVKDKDKTHAEILTQMREDRQATNQRLRWLEENVWNRSRAAAQRRKPASDP